MRKEDNGEAAGVRTGGGRPTRAEAAARTHALLDAARVLFTEKGFASSTIDELAATLRFSKHTIYRRFPSKLALLEAVIERDVERFRCAMADATSGAASQFDALHAMARRYFGFSASPAYSALYAAVALEAATSAHLGRKLQTWAAVSLEPLMAAMETLKPARGWNDGTTSDRCELLVDLLDGAATRAKWGGAACDAAALERIFARRWIMFLRVANLEIPDHPQCGA